ncbi:alpha/beta hydrolase [Burkholderia alba]|uniref:alpha/beta hydrolase n=1 Tax=Burkholderia alba TaxID=2683677 RepID=UPI002B0602B6|nr:alpha/beta hydrolase [Burkholderia alba]
MKSGNFIQAIWIGLLTLTAIGVGTRAGFRNADEDKKGAAWAVNEAVSWGACSDAWHLSSTELDRVCGTLNVPMQRMRQQQAGEVVKLAMTKLPATDHKMGSLILVSGGPGIPGVGLSLAQSAETSKLRKHFDIIAYDPRGVGQSEPKIRCTTDPKIGPYSSEWLRSCTTMTKESFISHLSTLDAVDDLEGIRVALGEEKITLLAYSYGTAVAQLYAEHYPQNVRAMVLDGVVDLSENYAAWRVNQSRGINLAFYRFARYCAGIAGCPLTKSPVEALDAYRTLLSRASTGAIRKPDGQPVSADQIHGYTQSALFWDRNWPELARTLTELRQLKVSVQTAELLDTPQFYKQDEAKASLVITCSDYGPLPNVAPESILRGTFVTISEEATAELADRTCAGWPFGARMTAATPSRDKRLPSLLFVAQTGDPTTPYGNAVKMSAAFGSPLLVREGNGHTFVLAEGFRCIDDKVVNYLLEPTKPVSDAYC